MTKTDALKHASPTTGSWSPQPANMEALVRGNIEQAADLGAGYVVIKLRSPIKSPLPVNGGATVLPLMTKECLVKALNRGGTLAGISEKPIRPPENDAFMRTMAIQEQRRRVAQEQSGELITAEDLAARLAVSTQAISKALKAGRLFALQGAGRRLLYPAFYADGKLSRRDWKPSPARWATYPRPASGNSLPIPRDRLTAQRHYKRCNAATVIW